MSSHPEEGHDGRTGERPAAPRGACGLLLGRNVIEWSALDGTSTTGAGTKVSIYGDFQSYLVADRLGMQAEIIPHLFGGSQRPTGQRGFWVMWRTATKVLVPNAYRYLEIV